MQIEELLQTGDLSNIKHKQILKMAHIAWPDDPQRAKQFATELVKQRLDAVERDT